MSGTVFRRDTGGLRMSLVTESGPCFVSVTLDESLEGTASYSCLGGGMSQSNWTPIDCASIAY